MENDLKVQITELEPAPGDILLVRAETVTGELIHAVKSVLPPEVQAIVLSVRESIEVVDEATMNRAGWFRAPKAACKCSEGGCGKAAANA